MFYLAEAYDYRPCRCKSVYYSMGHEIYKKTGLEISQEKLFKPYHESQQQNERNIFRASGRSKP